jgi:hypothetical protein
MLLSNLQWKLTEKKVRFKISLSNLCCYATVKFTTIHSKREEMSEKQTIHNLIIANRKRKKKKEKLCRANLDLVDDEIWKSMYKFAGSLDCCFKRYAFLRILGAVSCAVVVSLCSRICSYTVFASICDVLSISVDEFSRQFFFHCQTDRQ